MSGRSRTMEGLTTVSVSLGNRSYDILIQEGLLAQAGACLQRAGLNGRVAMVTNSTVEKLYGPALRRALKVAGFQPVVLVVPDGERVKSLRWIKYVLDQLIINRFERSDVVMAVGGGVIGDLAGFAAAIYLRGIAFVQVATTLVAQVDSSVGGKTGVNHRLGKNLIGAFYQPRLVLMDTATLRTLPPREWIAGMAEVIKYGMIADADFFHYLEQHMSGLLKHDPELVHHVVRRCCEIKADVVARDERESGLRRILNFGHTIGHAIESLSGYRRYLHGEAVGIGMVHEAELARDAGMCSEEVPLRQRELIRQAGLPDRLPSVTFAELWEAMQHDKKVVKGTVHCVLPRRVGDVTVAPLDRRLVERWFHRTGSLQQSRRSSRRRDRPHSLSS